MSDGRTIMQHIRLSKRERMMLARLADRRGLSMSDWMRLAIREAHETTAWIRRKNGPDHERIMYGKS